LFAINADLEIQVANLKLEMEGIKSEKVLKTKSSTEEVEALYASTAETEKKTVELIEENKALQAKYNGIEKLHAESLKKLYD
jgi:hypothetical protein